MKLRVSAWLAFIGAALVTVSGCDGSDPEPADPNVVFFTASDTGIARGESVILSWETRDAASVAIRGVAGEDAFLVDLGDAAADAGSVEVTPVATTTYTLTATGEAGSTAAARSVEVTVLPPALIGAFTIDPDTAADPGTEFTLAWETSGADRVLVTAEGGEVVVDGNAPDGSATVVPGVTTVYTLDASGPGGTATPAEVTALVRPVVDRFSVDADLVRVGDPIRVEWETRGAVEGTLTGPGGLSYAIPAADLAAGGTSVTAGSSGELVLTLVSGDLTASDSVSVTVTEGPRIAAFTANPAEVTAAAGVPSTVSLAWSVDGADTLTLTSDVLGAIDVSGLPVSDGGLDVPVEATQTFSLTAANDSGRHVAEAQVVAHAPPVIDRFAALPGVVGAGESVVLSWETTGATAVELRKDGVGLAVPAGAVDATHTDPVVAAGAEYLLVARNALGAEVTRAVQVTVGKPGIVAFTASPEMPRNGDAVTLAWECLGGVDLQIGASSGAAVPGCASADPAGIAAGSCTVTPTGSDVYTLTVSNASGSATAAAAVTVYGGPVIRDFAASASAVTEGERFDLTWRVDDAAGNVPTLALADDRGRTYDVSAVDPQNGTYTVRAGTPGSYVFTLTATAPGGTPDSATAAVEVTAAPVIDVFAADPAALDPTSGPSASELSWTTRHATSVALFRLDDAGRPIRPSLLETTDPAEVASSTYAVTPSATTGYRLVAENAAGSTDSADLVVSVGAATVLSFDVSAPGVSGGFRSIDILEGGRAELEWEVGSADTVTVSPSIIEPYASSEPFLDVSVTGTEIVHQGTYDAGGGVIVFPAGFRFPFFGSDRTEALLVSDGYLCFDLNAMSLSANDAMPDPSSPYGGVIAPFWDDQDRDQHLPIGRAYRQFFPAQGDMPAHLVLQVKNSHFWTAPVPSDLNYEIILYENGVFEFRYGTMTAAADQSRADGGSASIGFENDDGTDGYLYSHNTVIPGGLSGTGLVFDPRLPTRGTRVVMPDRTTTWLLTAGNDNGTGQASVTVRVWPDLATTHLPLTADPSTVHVGEAYTLRWNIPGATSSRVLNADTLQPVPGCAAGGNPTIVGSCTLTAGAAGDYGYVLEVTNPLSTGRSAPVVVRVDP